MNKTEHFIHQLMQSLSINAPSDLGIDSISTKINVPVIFWEHGSEAVFYCNRFKIFLNKYDSPQKQWEDFGHESCHVLQHSGTQSKMHRPFLYYQEKQASYFAYHFCVPTFMLDNLKEVTIRDIMNLFNVNYDFALRRLEMYQSKFYIERSLMNGKRSCKEKTR